MARCPFAEWKPLGPDAGAFTSGPFKIVHHTTEGSTIEGALSTLGTKHVEAHFVVDDERIVQLIDTSRASRSLRNAAGGVETNRDSAIQIEVVGFASKPKGGATLENVRRLCRWLEGEHGIPRYWPAGLPPTSPRGPFVRDAHIWDTQGGHYGHSQVPENSHWDPGYTRGEIDFIMHGPGRYAGSSTAPAPTPAPVPSQVEGHVADLQRLLIGLGLDPGRVDNLWGPKTRSALLLSIPPATAPNSAIITWLGRLIGM